MPESENKELVLSSTFGEIEQIEPFVKELQQWIRFSDDNFARVMLTLSEAVTNAVEHGNKNDPQKKVHISATHEARTLKIDVRDEGEGFDPDEVPDPLKEENLLKEEGRGVYLIQQYADNIEYSEGGTCVTMYFRLDPL